MERCDVLVVGGGPAGETPELYFCQDLAGYGWVFRKGDYLNVGLGREDPRDLPGQGQRFCAWLRKTGRLAEAPPPSRDTPIDSTMGL